MDTREPEELEQPQLEVQFFSSVFELERASVSSTTGSSAATSASRLSGLLPRLGPQGLGRIDESSEHTRDLSSADR